MIAEQLTVEDIQTLFAKKYESRRSGTAGTFIPLTDKLGLKLYQTKWKAMCAFESQRKAFNNDLGPEAYFQLSITYKKRKWYGYVTELVEVLEPTHMGNTTTADDWDEYENEYQADLDKLYDQLIKAGLVRPAQDLHPGNIGFKNGKIICVDFS